MANPPKTPTAEDSLLLAEIQQLTDAARQSTCTVGTILEQMSSVDRTGLTQALDTVTIPGTAIAEILRRRGFRVSSHTVQRHRRGGCGCGRG